MLTVHAFRSLDTAFRCKLVSYGQSGDFFQRSDTFSSGIVPIKENIVFSETSVGWVEKEPTKIDGIIVRRTDQFLQCVPLWRRQSNYFQTFHLYQCIRLCDRQTSMPQTATQKRNTLPLKPYPLNSWANCCAPVRFLSCCVRSLRYGKKSVCFPKEPSQTSCETLFGTFWRNLIT